MTILTFTTGLTNEFTFALNSLADGFTIGNLGIAYSAVNVEFSLQTVDDDIKVEFTHTGDDGLGRFGIRADTEGRVFFSKFAKGNAHLFLVGLGLRFDGYRNNRFREDHGFENDRSLFIAERIARARIFQANGSCDITSIDFFDFRSMVGVHAQDTADTFSLAFGRVVDVGASRQFTGVDTEESQAANIGVGCDLEGKGSKGSIIAGRTSCFFARFRIHALDVSHIGRSRHVSNDGIQKGLHAFVLIGRTAGDREHLAGTGHLTDGGIDFIFRKVFAFKVFFHQVVVAFSNGFQEVLAPFLGFFNVFFRNRLEFFVFAKVIAIDDSLHLDKVDEADELIFSTHRNLDRHSICAETIFHHLDSVEEVSARRIHLVHVRDTRYIVFFCLTPYGFGLGFNTALGTEYGNGAVEYTQGTFNFNREVNVARGINDVDGMSFPGTGRCSRSNRDPTFLFLTHPVHGSGAVVDFADLMGLTGIEQDTFRGGRFTGINVCHDADISDFI